MNGVLWMKGRLWAAILFVVLVVGCGGEPADINSGEGKAEPEDVVLPDEVQLSFSFGEDGTLWIEDQGLDVMWRLQVMGTTQIIEIADVAVFMLRDRRLIKEEIQAPKLFRAAVLNLVAFYKAQEEELVGEDPAALRSRVEQASRDFAVRVEKGLDVSTRDWLQSEDGKLFLVCTAAGMAAATLTLFLEASAGVWALGQGVLKMIGAITSTTVAAGYSWVAFAAVEIWLMELVGWLDIAPDEAIVFADCDLRECDYSGIEGLFGAMM